MKGLAVVGTAAMFLVGGGILMHGIPGAHHLVEAAVAAAGEASGLLALLVPTLTNALAGIVAGGVTVAVLATVQRVKSSGARTK